MMPNLLLALALMLVSLLAFSCRDKGDAGEGQATQVQPAAADSAAGAKAEPPEEGAGTPDDEGEDEGEDEEP